MKNILLATLVLSFAGLAQADIQAPPGVQFKSVTNTPINKLGRGISNIAFAVNEIPATMISTRRSHGINAAWGPGLTKGVTRTIGRTGFGVWEVVTFPFPTHKGTFRQPYTRGELYPRVGLTEFAPELGFKSGTTYNLTNAE